MTCERVGKDRMDYVVESLKEGNWLLKSVKLIRLPEEVVDTLLYLPE